MQKNIRRDFKPLFCSHCKKPFHSSCTKLSRDAATAARNNPGSWTCKRCISFLVPDLPLSDPNSKQSVSEKIQKKCKPSLKIIQWNADGLKPKLYELKESLLAKDIDVCTFRKQNCESEMPPHVFPDMPRSEMIESEAWHKQVDPAHQRICAPSQHHRSGCQQNRFRDNSDQRKHFNSR